MGSTEVVLDNDKIQSLRSMKVITSEEIPLLAGDIVFAENVITKSRRMIKIPESLTESKQILRG